MSDVAILDIGHGNLRSVALAFERLGARTDVVRAPAAALAARRLVLPGVGAAGQAMAALTAAGLDDALRQRTGPTLGICLGMQLLFDTSDEDGGTPLLGLLEGRVRALEPAPGRPVPHMGWSRLTARTGVGLEDGDYGWFAHGFACPDGPATAATFRFGDEAVPAALRHGALWGAQFHPERSSQAGARFLKAFLHS